MDNENLIQLRVMGLSYNQLQNGAYALLLAQVDGPYRIPVVIGAPEAQSIAIALEGIITPRPLTHDLFSTFAHAFGVQLTRVFIYRFEEGIFSSELSFSDGERVITLDARTSDAIALAIRSHTPIFTTNEIIEETGFIFEEADLENEDNTESEDTGGGPESGTPPSVEEMERELNRLIENEEYEEAARLNKLIQQRKSESGTDNI